MSILPRASFFLFLAYPFLKKVFKWLSLRFQYTFRINIHPLQLNTVLLQWLCRYLTPQYSQFPSSVPFHMPRLVAQLSLILCDPMDCSPQTPLSLGILQARILKWVAMPSSRGSSQLRDRTQVSSIAGGFSTILATTWLSFISLNHKVIISNIIVAKFLQTCHLSQKKYKRCLALFLF